MFQRQTKNLNRDIHICHAIKHISVSIGFKVQEKQSMVLSGWGPEGNLSLEGVTGTTCPTQQPTDGPILSG